MPPRKNPLISSPAPDPFGQRLGICLTDLDRINPMIRDILLQPRKNLDLRSGSLVQVDKDYFDEICIPFRCDLLTAACICDTLRGRDKRVGVYPTRVYIVRSKSWSKLPSHVVLSVVSGGNVELNPAIFKVEVQRLVGTVPPSIKIFNLDNLQGVR